MDTIKYENLNLFKRIKLGFRVKMLNKFAAAPDEYYSLTPPNEEWMRVNGKTFWICPVNNEEFFESASDNTENISEIVNTEEIENGIIDIDKNNIDNKKPILLDNFDNNDENDDSEKEEII